MLEHGQSSSSAENDRGAGAAEASERLAPRGTGVTQGGRVSLGHQRLDSRDGVVQSEAEDQHQNQAGDEVASGAASQRSAVNGSSAGEHRHADGAQDDSHDAGNPADPQSALTADGVGHEADGHVGEDSANVVPGLQVNGVSSGEAVALEPRGDPGVHAVNAELADEVSGPHGAGADDELAGEQGGRAGLSGLRRNDQQVGIELGVNVTRSLNDLMQTIASLVLHAIVGIPVRGLAHREEQDDAVDDRNSADQVAQTPVLNSGGAVHEGDLGSQEAQTHDRLRSRADRGGDQASENPADDHEGHAERNEDAALLGRHALGEHGGNNRDTRTNTKTSDQTERAEELIARRESLRQREDAVEDNGDGQHLLTTELVGHDATNSTAENHAQQAPGGQRARQGVAVGASGDSISEERRTNVRVGRVDDHEVVAVEDHCEREKHEHNPSMAGNTSTVDDFGNGELFSVHQSLL